MSAKLRVSGSLEELDVAELVRSLWRSAETGVLELGEASGPRRLHFRQGDIIFASSEDPEDRLAAVLLKRGRLRLAQARELVDGAGDCGDLLLERGLLSREQVAQARAERLVHIVTRVLVSARGRYSFVFGEPQPGEQVRLRQGVGWLLMRAVRRIDDLGRVLKALDPDGARWQAAEGAVTEDLGLEPEEEELLGRLGSPASFEELGEKPGMTDFELARALWGLVLVGVLTRSEPPCEPCRPGSLDSAGAQSELPSQSLRDAGPRDELARFNEKHAYIYRVLRVELGAGADAFLKACVRRAGKAVAGLLEGVPLDPQGRWDLERLRANVASRGGEDPGDKLRALLDAETHSLMRLTDHDRGALIIDGLRAIDQRWAAGQRSTGAGP